MLSCICNSNSINSLGKRDNLLAATAFHSLTPEKQDHVMNEVYGNAKPAEESPTFIHGKLEDLDRQLSLISEEVKKYYTRAITDEKQKQTVVDGDEEGYFSSPKFRLMFLRSEQFDTLKAARKLVAYFHEKFYLFGEEKLACKIKREDLNDIETMALRSGGLSITGETDLAGRPIFVVRRNEVLKQNVTAMKRALFYVFQNVMDENEIAQKKGIVVILYNIDSPIFYVASNARRIIPIPRMIRHCLPVRFAAVHNCYNDLKENMVVNFFITILPQDVRARFQFHFLQTHEECIYTLMEYGIQMSNLPFTLDGEYRYEMLNSYLERLHQAEH